MIDNLSGSLVKLLMSNRDSMVFKNIYMGNVR